jgi:PAS domain S-box-containing protein
MATVQETELEYLRWRVAELEERLASTESARMLDASEMLQALIVASPLPIVAFTRDGAITLWNPAAERVFGWAEAEVLGKPLPFIPEEKTSEHLAMRQRDLRGEGFTSREIQRRRKDGTPIDISVSTAPMHDAAGQITGIMSVYADITEQKKIADEQRRSMEMLRVIERQLRLLVEASGALLATPHSEKVLRIILELAQRFVDAEAYAVWRKSGDEWRLLESAGLSEGYSRVIRGLNVELPQDPLVVPDVEASEILEHRAAIYRTEGIRSMLTVPLRIHGEVEGTIVFYYRSLHSFSEAEKRISGALGNLASSALATAELYERQAKLRELAQSAEQRSSFLARVGEELASSLDYETTLTNVAKLAVPWFADWCAVDIVQEDGVLRRLAVQHINPEKISFGYEFARKYPPSKDIMTRRVVRTGEAILIPEIPNSVLSEWARNSDHLDSMRKLGLNSFICAPLAVHGRTLGVLTFVAAESGRHYSPGDLQFAKEIARRAAVAVENARLFRNFRGLSEAAIEISAADSIDEILRVIRQRAPLLIGAGTVIAKLCRDEVSAHSGALSAPLKGGDGRNIGSVQVMRKWKRPFTENDRAILVQLAEMASIGIENTELTNSLRLSNEELRRANEDLNQFAYSASHDLQEPLRMISIYTQLLNRRLGNLLDADARDFMKYTLDGAQRMEMLLRDLLAYTHAVNIRGVPDKAVDSGAALRMDIENLQAAVATSNATIVAGELPAVRAYDVHLVQLFQNLIGNALKYRSKAPPVIEIRASENGDGARWLFSVRDNGIGIAPRFHEQVFGLFKRLYSAQEYPGTGIGLAICQKLVERYGGGIWLESEEGSVSTFFFTLPA